ncbi:hypothetical protein LshimejAT787_1400020 [Lyophyllum shimeji]|uniref:Uncharacterized protein n=1 Tax=Lyophyllum shimeji TaxID=47721 RepID=A0A9P3PWW3_LYOSH|nr:hypothetical protein LshimejAT787_1400020 [Lyophyllum shimeji]
MPSTMRTHSCDTAPEPHDPIPYAPNREEHHSNIAASLRSVQDAKRAKTAAQAAAKKAKAVTERAGGPVPAAKRRRVDDEGSDGEGDLDGMEVDERIDEQA